MLWLQGMAWRPFLASLGQFWLSSAPIAQKHSLFQALPKTRVWTRFHDNLPSQGGKKSRDSRD